MAGKADGRASGIESLSRGEVTSRAHDVAKLVAGLGPDDLDRFKERGTTVHWTDYGRFAISVWDREAPSSLYGCVIVAGFESERFIRADLRKRSSKFRSLLETFGIGMNQRWIDGCLQAGDPVSDDQAAELVDYLTTVTE